MTDVSNIDYKKITSLIGEVDKLTKESHKGLSKSLIDSIPEMVLSSDDVTSLIGEQITSVQKAALNSINAIFENVLEHKNAVQKMQANEKPSDFVSDPVPDLREKISTGFPKEDVAFFKEVIPTVKF
ncbi:MAG: hypothetical protein GKC53_01655 [Neisseriaceae bacterium]|nr:MAG: hypothetical protein GKC53_01655 [Neisseriaceae bacterium]